MFVFVLGYAFANVAVNVYFYINCVDLFRLRIDARCLTYYFVFYWNYMGNFYVNLVVIMFYIVANGYRQFGF